VVIDIEVLFDELTAWPAAAWMSRSSS